MVTSGQGCFHQLPYELALEVRCLDVEGCLMKAVQVTSLPLYYLAALAYHCRVYCTVNYGRRRYLRAPEQGCGLSRRMQKLLTFV